MIEPAAWIVAPAGVFLIAAMKGAFGGGFAILGIPLLALAMDPIAAGAMLAPLLLVMDGFALRRWRPATWSGPDLLALLPGLAAGVGLGTALVAVAPSRLVAVLMAGVTLSFAGHWFWQRRGGRPSPARGPVSRWRAFLAGTGSGVTTMLAHAGGPPLALYLLRRDLTPAVYAGTTSLFFTVANALKVGPWLLAAPPTPELWALMALCVPVCWAGVAAGVALHGRLPGERMFWWCRLLLVAVALKLLWDGLAG
ncbi:MAG: sulfite exporter TauE/SafE family protein [Acetobacteraceae bacterium]|nr:sulfite exporter TauE/SafE family protein [Acetobacteraceae bacterium]